MNKMINVVNPMLVSAMDLIKKENSAANNKIFADELRHAKLLSPVVIVPAPVVDEKGSVTVPKGSQIQLPMIIAPDGKRFFTAYTDRRAMKNAGNSGKVNVLPFAFKDYVSMLTRAGDSCSGFVINPGTNGLIISKEKALAMAGSVSGNAKDTMENLQEDNSENV